MSLEYLGFEQEGCPWAEKAAKHSSMWWIVSLALGAPLSVVSSSALLSSAPTHLSSCVSSSLAAVLLQCRFSALLRFCARTVSSPSDSPTAMTSRLSLKTITTLPHPHLDLSLAFPDRVKKDLQAAVKLFEIPVPLSQFVSLPMLLGIPGRQALALCFQSTGQLPWEGGRPHSPNLQMRRELATLCR